MKKVLFILTLCIGVSIGAASYFITQNNKAMPKTALQESALKMLESGYMKYETTTKMPDGKTFEGKGAMAFMGENYYDSSNVHFIFVNPKWFISADHTDQTIKVILIDAWKKELGDYGSLSFFDFLFDTDSSFLKSMSISEKEISSSIYQVDYLAKTSTATVQKLSITYNKVDRVPLSYSGEILYPLSYTARYMEAAEDMVNQANETAHITFHVSDIQPASKEIFDHKRLITETKNKATINVYKNYSTIYSLNTQN